MSRESGWEGKPGWVAEISAELRFEFVMFVQDGGLECGHTVSLTVAGWYCLIVTSIAMPLYITVRGISSKQGSMVHW